MCRVMKVNLPESNKRYNNYKGFYEANMRFKISGKSNSNTANFSLYTFIYNNNNNNMHIGIL